MFKLLILISLGSFLFLSCTTTKEHQEIQVTHNLNKNFDLDGRYNFSPDDKWLVYDTRVEGGGIGRCLSIEKVNVETGEIVVLYETKNPTQFGPGVGAPSYNHIENKIIFIHGLLNCNKDHPYQQWRRTGVIIDEANPGVPIFMDARDVTPPFTPGALRGGTHQHEWSGDGKWIGYTYNDAIMKKLENKTGVHWNLRTIGVSTALCPVEVDHDSEGENNDGTHFSVLVVKVVPNPKPGSNEIDHANDDSWVGKHGYEKEDGTWQRARAFVGTVRNKSGKPIREIFIVDIPEKIDIPSKNGPLEGTTTTFPMPPQNTIQRRLTFTAESEHPGVLGFTRCSSDGKFISYRAKDKNGVLQIFFISPFGGNPIQVTKHDSDVISAVQWSPDNSMIYYVCDNSIIECNVREGENFGQWKRITQKTVEAPTNIILSHDGKTIAFNRNVPTEENKKKMRQVFIVKL